MRLCDGRVKNLKLDVMLQISRATDWRRECGQLTGHLLKTNGRLSRILTDSEKTALGRLQVGKVRRTFLLYTLFLSGIEY